MERLFKSSRAAGLAAIAAAVLGMACGAPPATNNAAIAVNQNSNANIANVSNVGRSNSVDNSSSNGTVSVDTREPEQYQATVTIKFEATGPNQKTEAPTLTATVARNSTDRRMEFALPVGGSIVFLDKNGTNYLIIPQKKQYAELDRESVGFDVRRLLMPEQIVQQIKSQKGVERVGEEKYNGRDVIRYKYSAIASTQTKAGDVTTDSFLLVDKETGLPLHSETESNAQAGVQGFNGLRVVTEISDIKTQMADGIFDKPADYQKIDSAQVKQQVDLVFNTIAAFVGQMLKQSQATPAGSPAQ